MKCAELALNSDTVSRTVVFENGAERTQSTGTLAYAGRSLNCNATHECFGRRRPEAREAVVCRPASPEYQHSLVHFETQLLPQPQHALVGDLKALLAALGGAVDHLQQVVSLRQIKAFTQERRQLVDDDRGVVDL